MQKLLAVLGGLKSYLANPEMLVTERSRECPFCPDGHRLQLLGHYHRIALVPGDGTAWRIPVRRLLCVLSGRTVSLLPEFCIPRRQHGPELLGTFLSEYARGRPLLLALRLARPQAPSHSVAQSLLRGFLTRAGPLRAYLARFHPRALEPPSDVCGPRRAVSALLERLCRGFGTAGAAFVRHGVGLHATFHVGLA